MKKLDVENIISWKIIALLLLVTFISRVPQLLSSNLMLDGDEAVVGLMAKHLMELKEFKLFFYGQNYGLTILESGIAAVVFKLFGISDIGLKISALLIWFSGVVFMFYGFRNIASSQKWAFIVMTLFVLNPAWSIWSMKARGGYVSAFLFFSIIFWVASNKKLLQRNISWLFLGVLSLLTYSAQPLWLAGIIPVLFKPWWKTPKKWATMGLYILGAALVYLLISLAPSQESWWQPTIISKELNFQFLLSLPTNLYTHFSGFYFFKEVYEAPIMIKVVTLISLSLALIGIGTFIYRYAKKKQTPWSNVFFASLVLTFGLLLLVKETRYSPRYMLPISALLFLWLGMEFKRFFINQKIWTIRISAVLIILSFISSFSFKDYSNMPDFLSREGNEKRHLMKLIRQLKNNNIHHAVTTRGMQQWIIMFYSEEDVICRYLKLNDRYPPYVQNVNTALKSNLPVAVVGYYGVFRGLQANPQIVPHIANVKNKYFYFPYANQPLLSQMQYEFDE